MVVQTSEERIVLCLTKHVDYTEEFDPPRYLMYFYQGGHPYTVCAPDLRGSFALMTTSSPERAQGYHGVSKELRAKALAAARTKYKDARFVLLRTRTEILEL